MILAPKIPKEEVFRDLEQSLHRPEVRSSRSSVEALLASAFTEIGASGRFYDRGTTVEGLLNEPPTSHEWLPVAQDFVASQLAEDVVLVTYRIVHEAAGNLPGRSTLRSSIWVLEDGSWRMRFHQGTIIPPTRASSLV